MGDELRHEPYDSPAGGWGSLRSLAKHGWQQASGATVAHVLERQNKPGGFMCVSCAWAKPAEPHPAEFCENGAKATMWELTQKRTTPEFFAEHPLAELREWTDHKLEDEGRLTHPLRYDAASDRYVPVAWDEAFRAIGDRLKALDPRSVVFYASGRASLETSYMYQLLARLYGSNNLPDSSNMCHETTSVALPESIGVPVGTVTLDDFEHTTCILAFGQNVGTSSPRMLHQLQEARERGVEVLVVNPMVERGWVEFVSPQRPLQMLTNAATDIATRYLQVRAGGDLALLFGMAKTLIALDEQATAEGSAPVLDHDFIDTHTYGYAAFHDAVLSCTWEEIERESGLARNAIEDFARVYAAAPRVIALYGMGLTQHRHGVETVQTLINLLLMRGQIGLEGAGILPVRGHSNVQGQRTVGISEKPELVPLDRMAEQFGFEPPREKGMTTVEVCRGVVEGRVRAFLGLGGNFVRAAPDPQCLEPAWSGLDLAVHVATKLNRSHLLPAAGDTFLLPCLGRSEIDLQASGPQIVTMEDSTAHIHASHALAEPASPHLLSEPRIVAEIAKALLPPNPKVPWDEWVADYGRVRDAIEASYPKDFKDFNERLDTPGGFPRPLAARERRFETDTGRANFKLPGRLSAADDEAVSNDAVFRLMTLRSNDQFNTTVYGYDDRFRGVHGTRLVLMLHPSDMALLGLEEGATVRMTSAIEDGVERSLGGLRAIAADIPRGCCAGYYPECNVLIPIAHHDVKAKTPAAKSVPVRIAGEAPAAL